MPQFYARARQMDTPLAESAFISQGAHVIGNVEIGENAGVWPGVVIRADFASIKIGSQTIIEDNSVVHCGEPMEIGDNVIVGHSAVVHGRKIGNNTLIGNHATVLDETEIGNFCVIGAGSLVSRGMQVRDRSLVFGVPAKILGEVDPRQLERLEMGNVFYQEKFELYRAAGL